MLTSERVLKMLPKSAHKAAKRDIRKAQLIHSSALVGFFLGGAALVGVPTAFYLQMLGEVLEVSQVTNELSWFFIVPFGTLVGGFFGAILGNFFVGELHQEALEGIADSDYSMESDSENDDDDIWGW